MPKKRKIVVVGGGSAGWMTASLLCRTLGDSHTIELLESSQVSTIGVGEGSTPKLKALFQALGVDESEWMPACDATYKSGIRFKGWSSHEGFDSFFHGFYSHFDREHLKELKVNSVLRRARMDVHAHPDIFLYNAYLADKHLSPIPEYAFPFDVQYAYHFDAALLGDFLKSYSMSRGVTWRDAHIVDQEYHADGSLAAVLTHSGDRKKENVEKNDRDRVEADIFFDCTGFSALLIEKGLGAQHISYSNKLFNDAAVAISISPTENPKPQTTASTLSYGWAWEIPLQSRIGNGYVYSSQYCSKTDAEAELRAHIGEAAKGSKARHLSMRIGRLDKPWLHNCVAVGLSQGFVEPLEATGLALAQFTVTRFLHHYLELGCTEPARTAFNGEVNEAFDGVRDFIAAHYLTASRDDTPYWRNVRTNKAAMSDDITAAFNAWFKGNDFDQVLKDRRMTDYFSINSWYYIMCGKGIFPPLAEVPSTEQLQQQKSITQIGNFLERCTLNHPTHKERLIQLKNSSQSPSSQLTSSQLTSSQLTSSQLAHPPFPQTTEQRTPLDILRAAMPRRRALFGASENS